METIKKSIGQGWGKGELYHALAYNASDKYGGLAIKQVRFNPESGSTAIIIGDSTTAITLATYAQRAISIYTTSASTDGSNTVLPVYINATMSATGGVGRAFEARLNITGKLATWGNAIKGYIDLTGGTGTSGLASAICAEMKMSASATLGTFGVLELELVCPTSWVAHDGIGTNSNSFIYAQVSGATKGEFDDHGYLFNIQGLTSGTTHLLYNNTLKCAIGSTKWYIPLSSAENGYTSAYQTTLTNTLTIGVDGTGHDVIFYGDTVGKYLTYDADTYTLHIRGAAKFHNRPLTTNVFAVEVKADTKNATGVYTGALQVTVREYPTDDTSAVSVNGSDFTTYLHDGDTKTAGYLTSIFAKVENQGTFNGAAIIMTPIYSMIGEGSTGTITAVNHICGLWLDSHLDTTITAGSFEMIYMTNNGDTQMNSAIHLTRSRVTNFVTFDGSGAMVSADIGATAIHKTVCKSIKIDIDGTTHYLLASTVVATS